MPTVKVDDLEIYYETHGEGPPLLLVAGLASDSQSWQPVLDTLAADFKVIVFDNRGVGRTTPQEAATSITRMADDCVGLARQLGIEKFHLLGHSMGGFIALETAIRFPDRVDKLIVAAAAATDSARNHYLFADWAADRNAGMDPERWFCNFFYWIFTAGFFDDSKSVQAALRFALDYPYPQSPAAFDKQVRAMADFDCRKRFCSVHAKTLVLAGGEDLLFPPGVCRELARTIPQAEFSQIEGAAHSIFIEKPKDFTAAVLGFLGQG